MKRFTEAIKKCLETENWYGALFMSLAMPDICGKIAYPDSSTGKRYRQWFDNYLSNHYKHKMGNPQQEIVFLSANDCYALRCSLLHMGMDDVTEQDAKDTVSRFSFSTAKAHCNKINDVLQLNVKIFCEDIILAVEKWAKDFENNSDVQNRISKLLVVHIGGYSPMPGVWIG